jgi:homoserine kinase
LTSVSFVAGAVRVAVPATSANLGPGFDSLGLALDLRDELTASVLDEGLVVEVQGEGAGTLALDETHLVVRSMWAGFAAMGVAPPGIRLECRNAIPQARGLGSSSAAIVGGLGLARALVVDGAALLPDPELVWLAADLEGHPDNVAPAALGGLVVSGREGARWYAVRVPVDERVRAVVFVPPFALSTELARGLLPASVPHADAAASTGRAALLVAALGGVPEHLLAATRDYLHQDYRRPAMPDSLALVDALRADGVPAVVSGAGPTVLAFVADGVPGLPAADDVASRCPTGWTARELGVDRAGIRALTRGGGAGATV